VDDVCFSRVRHLTIGSYFDSYLRNEYEGYRPIWHKDNASRRLDCIHGVALAFENNAQEAINFDETSTDSPIGGAGSDGHFGSW
jgi:hypothetical protein